MKLLKLPLIASLLLAPRFARAADFCSNPSLGATPILADGRVMPLFVYAGKLKSFLFKKDPCTSMDAVELYCRLSRKELACAAQIKADHRKTVELAGGDSTEILRKNQAVLMQTYHQLMESEESGGGFATDLSNVLTRIDKLNDIEAGEDWKTLDDNKKWISLASMERTVFDSLVLASRSRLNDEELSALDRETRYEKIQAFRLSAFLALLGFLFSLAAGRSRGFDLAAMVMIASTLALETYAIALRVLISGRAPVTNMFETVMWVSLSSFVLAVIMGFKLKDRRVWAFGFAANLLGLFMLNFANNMLDASIQPLVPVLRDNFWLSTHVTSVVTSYACFALSWLIANAVLIRRWIGGSDAWVKNWNSVIRIAMQVGSVFLAAGVILGGVWADYSWGRFWGWDPKETWSLIALMVYVIVLHGRYVGWFRDEVFTMMAAFAYMFVIMAWFGVNFILAAGLHSYGFSSGGSAFIVSLVILQGVILAASSVQHFARRSRT